MLDSDTKNMISVWIGTSNKTLDEFNKYTEGMEDSDSQCPAFADFGVSFIDSDFFVAFRTKNGEIVPIEILAEEIGTHSKKATEEIIRASKKKVWMKGILCIIMQTLLLNPMIQKNFIMT